MPRVSWVPLSPRLGVVGERYNRSACSIAPLLTCTTYSGPASVATIPARSACLLGRGGVEEVDGGARHLRFEPVGIFWFLCFLEGNRMQSFFPN